MSTTTTRCASKILGTFDPRFIRRTALTRFSEALRSESTGQVTLRRSKPDAFDTTLRKSPLERERRSLSISLRSHHSSSSRDNRRLT